MKREIDTQESIKRILATPLESRVMQPLYGSKLFELIDRSVDDEWVLDAIAYTYEAIEQNESRVVVSKVSVNIADSVSIVIAYEENGTAKTLEIPMSEVNDAAA